MTYYGRERWIEVYCKGIQNTPPHSVRKIKVRETAKHYYEQDGTKYVKSIDETEYLAVRIVKSKDTLPAIYHLYALEVKS